MTYLARHKVLRRSLEAAAVATLAVLLIGWFYLDRWALHYVNGVLHDMGGYEGSVQSIDMDLYRGAYRANNLVIKKKEGGMPVPFVAIDHADFSLQWSALWHRRVVASVTLLHPVINFAVKDKESQTGTGFDWTVPIKKLVPIDINYVDFRDGQITYQDFSSNPPINIYIRHMEGYVRNLRNVENPTTPLPSTLDIRGDSIGQGHLEIRGRLNILKPVPDMNLNAQLENADLTAMNNFSHAYGAFDFKNGDLDIYSQLAVKDSAVAGYVKLLARHVAVNTDQTAGPLQSAWASIVAAIIKVFTNPTQDQFATRADLEGNLNNINANTWTALASIIDNAFIEALHRGLDTDNPNVPKPEPQLQPEE